MTGTKDGLEALEDVIGTMGRVAVAFSGGMDSTLLLHVATKVLGDDAVAVLCDTGLMSTSEMNDAILLANEIDAHLKIIGTRHMDSEGVVANGEDRCYHCKARMFDAICDFARAEKLDHIVCGDNLTDLERHRPGRRAREERGIRAPLEEARMTQEDVERASMEIGLRTAFKAKTTCLATRIPMGTPLTRDALRRVARAEDALRSMGVVSVRVRDHGDVASVEVGPDDMERVFAQRSDVIDALRIIGFSRVTLDLDGYRRS